MTTTNSPDDLLLVEEVAELIRIPASTLRTWRSLGRGPKSFKLGRRVVYRRTALDEWLVEQEKATARGGAE